MSPQHLTSHKSPKLVGQSVEKASLKPSSKVTLVHSKFSRVDVGLMNVEMRFFLKLGFPVGQLPLLGWYKAI